MAQNSSVQAPSLVTMSPQPFANENDPSKERPTTSRRSKLARKFMNAVRWAERRNSGNAIHGNPSVYDSRVFPWVADLEANWTIIRGELAKLMMRRDALTSHGDRFGNRSGNLSSPTIGEDRGWTTFVLSNYYRRHERNIDQCPETWRLVQCVPGLVSVMFSVLEPGARLPAHHGPYNGLLRLHLGLIVPEPREAVAIRIDGEVHHWEEGRALIFDDTFEHEARNESGHTRVVLFIDFERPLKFPARLVNRALLRNYFFRPFVREGAEDQGLWARRFYREAQALRGETRTASAQDEAPLELTVDQVSEQAPSALEPPRTLAEALDREWPMPEKQS
jgi:ornithine lipid ester-linked acyl 2-hydroxylase